MIAYLSLLIAASWARLRPSSTVILPATISVYWVLKS